MTRTEIYRQALLHLQETRHIDAYRFVASQLGISMSALYLIVPVHKTDDNNNPFRGVIEEEMFFRLTEFPQGLCLKAKFLTPSQDTPCYDEASKLQSSPCQSCSGSSAPIIGTGDGSKGSRERSASKKEGSKR